MEKKIKYVLVLLTLIFAFPVIVKAECSYERQAELSKIASNVDLSYSYEMDENKYPVFTVNATNLTNDIYIVDYVYGIKTSDPEYNFVYNLNGTTLKYDIFSNDENCSDVKLITKNITLPTFNKFSQLKSCTRYPNFKYCQMWMNLDSVSQEQFDSELSEYLKEMDATTEISDENTNTATNFISDNLFWIIISLSLIIIVPFLIYGKRRMQL